MRLCLLTAFTCGMTMNYHVEAQAANRYDKMVIADVDSSLNVREKATTTSSVVGQMKRGATGTIIAVGKKWTKIKSGDVTGYVSNDYIRTGEEMEQFAKENVQTKNATVTTDVLNVRAKKSTSSKVLGKVTKGTTFTVKEQARKWTKVTYRKQNAYLFNDYISVDYLFETATPVEAADPDVSISDNEQTTVGEQNLDSSNNSNSGTNNNNNSNNSNSSNSNGEDTTVTIPDDVNPAELRQELVEYALQFVGNPYVYGGTSLTEGADCSGFVQSIFGKFGIKLNRVSADQALNGREVSIDQIQPGDLIFYVSRGSSRISHVSLYIGNGQVVHALNQSKGICVSDMYYNTPYTIRNVID